MSVEPKESLSGREQQHQGSVPPSRANTRQGLKTAHGLGHRRPWVTLVRAVSAEVVAEDTGWIDDREAITIFQEARLRREEEKEGSSWMSLPLVVIF